jgi:hypothetical protein
MEGREPVPPCEWRCISSGRRPLAQGALLPACVEMLYTPFDAAKR